MTLNDLLTPIINGYGLKQVGYADFVVWYRQAGCADFVVWYRHGRDVSDWVCDVYSDHVWVRGTGPLQATDPEFIDKLRNGIEHHMQQT